MLLKERSRDELVEVLVVQELFNPFMDELSGRYQHGEDVQEAAKFKKSDLCFLSGEALPQCWITAHYRDQELKRA